MEVKMRDGVVEVKLSSGKQATKSMTLEEKIAHATELHEDVFIQTRVKGGEFLATAAMINPEYGEIIGLPQWGQHKDVLSRMLHETAVKNRTLVIVFAADGWYVERTQEQFMNDKRVRPRDAADRKEALIISTIWPDGSSQMKFRPYHMDGNTLIWEESPDTEHTDTEQHIVAPWMTPGSGTVQ